LKKGEDMRGLEIENDHFTVSARDVYSTLGATKRFNAWFKRQAERFSLVIGVNYCTSRYYAQNGQNYDDYLLTTEAAYKIAGRNQVNTAAAAMVKDNFALQASIMVQLLSNPEQAVLFFSQIATEQAKKLAEKEELLLEQTPKVEAYEELMECSNAISFRELAGVLTVKGMGRNNLFKFLRDRKVLDSFNNPYQQYINKGWFKLQESYRTHPYTGIKLVETTTQVMQLGVDGIRKMLKKDGYE
jgi:anti-repressor protein